MLSVQFDIELRNDPEWVGGRILRQIEKQIHEKDGRRNANYGQWADKTILVLEIRAFSISLLKPYLYTKSAPRFSENGFLEIWIADYSSLDAYGDIEVFGLCPDKWWGYHQRPESNRKPYG